MRRNEWLESCLVAAIAALAVVVAALPAATWATGATPLATVPALPPAELSIPTLNAKVSAVAEPNPAQPVKVKLTLTTTPGAQPKAGTDVPVILTLMGTTDNPESRVGPRPTQVSRIEVSLHIDADGAASAVVDLPLTWAQPVPPATQPANSAKPATRLAAQTTSYRMILSSPLVTGSVNTNLLLAQVDMNGQRGQVQLQSQNGNLSEAMAQVRQQGR